MNWSECAPTAGAEGLAQHSVFRGERLVKAAPLGLPELSRRLAAPRKGYPAHPRCGSRGPLSLSGPYGWRLVRVMFRRNWVVFAALPRRAYQNSLFAGRVSVPLPNWGMPPDLGLDYAARHEPKHFSHRLPGHSWPMFFLRGRAASRSQTSLHAEEIRAREDARPPVCLMVPWPRFLKYEHSLDSVSTSDLCAPGGQA
jgi:hypothetical protein